MTTLQHNFICTCTSSSVPRVPFCHLVKTTRVHSAHAKLHQEFCFCSFLVVLPREALLSEKENIINSISLIYPHISKKCQKIQVLTKIIQTDIEHIIIYMHLQKDLTAKVEELDTKLNQKQMNCM